MRASKLREGRRWGAAAIETALVIIPMTIFLMGVFEYGRLLLVWNVLNNAAREGCRYALVNNTATTISGDVTNIVAAKMGNQTSSFTGLTVTVSGTHNGVSTTVNNLVAGDLISVTVSGTYKFMGIIPYQKLSTLTITSSVTMVCEGAT